jgi:hypothetical protein
MVGAGEPAEPARSSDAAPAAAAASKGAKKKPAASKAPLSASTEKPAPAGVHAETAADGTDKDRTLISAAVADNGRKRPRRGEGFADLFML